MNEIQNFKTDEAELPLLDRLVDGELDEATRRQLLASFDHRPEGWRRCALAFLEAQSWGKELTVFSREPAKAPIQTVPNPEPSEQAANSEITSAVQPVEGSRHSSFRWSTFWAMAASFLLAFVGVLYLHGDLKFRPVGLGESIADQSNPPMRNGLVQARGQGSNANGPQIITVAFPNQNGKLQTMQLPVVEGNSPDDLLPGRDDPAVPPQVLEYFRNSGQEVKQEREIVPLQLQDGRRAFMPVNRVRVVPADRPFQ